MKKEGEFPCTGCGEQTITNLGHDADDGTYRRIPVCLECLELWQGKPEDRGLLLAQWADPEEVGVKP